jgi:hypothetical protein
MSLKAVNIDPFLLAGIYPQPLIAGTGNTPGDPKTDSQPTLCLGNNRQKILLLIHNETTAYLPEPEFNLLSNLLSACRLSLDDVALVNMARLPATDIYPLMQQFTPHKTILFGKALAPLSAKSQKNSPWEEGTCQFLHTDSLEDMNNNKQLKVPFWNALKVFFNLTASQ